MDVAGRRQARRRRSMLGDERVERAEIAPRQRGTAVGEAALFVEQSVECHAKAHVRRVLEGAEHLHLKCILEASVHELHAEIDRTSARIRDEAWYFAQPSQDVRALVGA